MASQLTRMGIYKKLSYTTKTGERPVSKSEMVEMIASALDVPSEVLDGLDIAPKTALRYILRGLDEESDEYFRPDMLDSIELFYPHISREIWNKWDNSEEFYKYMDELIFQSRPRLREGFLSISLTH